MSNSKLKNRVIHILSWLIVLAIFAYVLVGIIPPEQAAQLSFFGKIQMAFHLLFEAIQQAHLPTLIGLVLGYTVWLVFIDSAGTKWTIERFNCPISLKEMIPARAITFLLAVLNYQAGQLALPLYLKRTHQVPILEGTGSVLFLGAMDLFIVILMATVGAVFMGTGALSQQVLLVGVIGIIVFTLNGFFWRSDRFAQPLIRLFGKLPVLGQHLLKEKSVFYAFQKAQFKDYVKLLFIRLPIHLGILLSMYFLIQIFGEKVPLHAIFIFFPVIMVISIVPIINVGAVGAAQASVVFFFKDYAPEATLFAVALTWALSMNIMKVLVGALFLTRYSSDLFRQPSQNTASV